MIAGSPEYGKLTWTRRQFPNQIWSHFGDFLSIYPNSEALPCILGQHHVLYVECLEPYLGFIHLQKVDSAFLGPFEHAGGQECPK
jgi:hypothetical protein